MERWLRYLVINYHLTRSETQLIRMGVYLLVVLVVIAVIVAIVKAVNSPPQQSATGTRPCPACGAASRGGAFCPECGQKIF